MVAHITCNSISVVGQLSTCVASILTRYIACAKGLEPSCQALAVCCATEVYQSHIHPGGISNKDDAPSSINVF